MKQKRDRPDLWMPWYIADYLADTTHLSNAEHGSYLLMLAHAWMNGGLLPLDDTRLSRLAHMNAEEWAYSRDVIMDFWTATEEGYVQKRLSRELERAMLLHQQRIDAGRQSAAKRWGNERDNDAITTVIPTVVTGSVTKPITKKYTSTSTTTVVTTKSKTKARREAKSRKAVPQGKGEVKPNGAWWTTDSGIQAKADELGLERTPGEEDE